MRMIELVNQFTNVFFFCDILSIFVPQNTHKYYVAISFPFASESASYSAVLRLAEKAH